MEKESLIFNISSDLYECDETQIINEYLEIIDFTKKLVNNTDYSYKIWIDIGCYHIVNEKEAFVTYMPRMHIIVSGKDIGAISEEISNMLSTLICYNCYDTLSYNGEILNLKNIKHLTNNSIRNDYWKVKNNRKKDKKIVS